LPHPSLHSFPTRRSSDLPLAEILELPVALHRVELALDHLPRQPVWRLVREPLAGPNLAHLHVAERVADQRPSLLVSLDHLELHRSEEHTSELQSPCNLVC